ncbi:MAG: YdcF family protein [Hellea sp.]|nr:YdcF family protein [Hellea sp.]
MASGVKNQSKTRAWVKFLLYLILIFLGFLIGGFFAFTRTVTTMAPPAQLPTADGVVVWTGKGGDRLSAAGQLLKDGHGERLLVSGVNEALTESELFKLLMISPEKGACCVDIDYRAQDTIGNARETHYWLKSMGYEHIILVTSDYHMPRARIEIGALSGRVWITPYPVSQDKHVSWWKNPDQRDRMVREYGKLLLTYLRQAGNKTQREAPELQNMPIKDVP